MRFRILRGAGIAVVLIAGLAASGCGSSNPAGSQTAAKLMPEVQALAQHAHSVHMSGSISHGSQTLSLDLSFSGNNTAGSVGIGGGSVTILALNGQAFVKVDSAFLKLAKIPSSVCSKVCGKYVQLPAASVSQMAGSITLHSFVAQAFSTKNISSAVKSGCLFTPATVNGQSVLQCHQDGYTVDVAAHGKPYLLSIRGPHGQNLIFSDWNSVVMPAAPPASEVINPAQLAG
jgi:hypothetical protein